MNFLQRSTKLLSIVVSTLVIPIVILNVIGEIASGIWLALLGEWSLIIHGILFMVISSYTIGFVLLPGTLFAIPGSILMEKGKILLASFLIFLSLLFKFGLIIIWCLWILNTYTRSATNESLIPSLIWSYGVAMAPWIFLAKKDKQLGDNEFSMYIVYFLEISYIVAMIMLFFGASFRSITITFSIIMLFVAVLISIVGTVMDSGSIRK